MANKLELQVFSQNSNPKNSKTNTSDSSGIGRWVSPLLFSTLCASLACASVPRVDALYDSSGVATISITDVVKSVGAGTVLILSEQHGNQSHYANQKLALAELGKSSNCTMSVGLEFLTYTDQATIDSYFDGTLAEADFLKAINWSGNPFTDYRDQALSPTASKGRLIGINAPRALTGAIAKTGISSLSADQMKQLPPGFQLGRQSYRDRFALIMGGHVKPDQLDRYFEAQSVWDDTMAWQAESFLKAHPNHCLAIIVGDFHAQYGGGLPDRLSARGVSSIVVSQIEAKDLSDIELEEEVLPNKTYGNRADAIWVSNTP